MYAANQEKLDNASSSELKMIEVKTKAMNTMSCTIMWLTKKLHFHQFHLVLFRRLCRDWIFQSYGGGIVKMDKCHEGMAISMVCPWRQCWTFQLLHFKREDEERGECAVCIPFFVKRIHLKVRRGCVRLKGALVGIDDEDDSTFTVTVDNKTFHFQAKDSEERERWIRALEDTVLRWGVF